MTVSHLQYYILSADILTLHFPKGSPEGESYMSRSLEKDATTQQHRKSILMEEKISTSPKKKFKVVSFAHSQDFSEMAFVKEKIARYANPPYCTSNALPSSHSLITHHYKSCVLLRGPPPHQE